MSAPSPPQPRPFISQWSSRYRGATVEDLEPPAALSLTPRDTIATALASAFERDYTHLTVVDGATRALLGYLSVPRLQALLAAGGARPEDRVNSVMARFRRRGRHYHVITMQTSLEELERFLFDADADADADRRDFAVITDLERRFVLGVATRHDLEEFVKRRPA